jgi:hypothetical protein
VTDDLAAAQAVMEQSSINAFRQGDMAPFFELPDGPINQWASARVYDRNSGIGRVVEDAHSVGEEYDDQLGEAVADEATEIVDRIRTLVCP